MKTTAILLIALLGLCAALPAKDSLQEDTPSDIVGEYARGIRDYLGIEGGDFKGCVKKGPLIYSTFL